MPKPTIDRNIFISAAKEVLGADITQITRNDMMKVCRKKDLDVPNWLTNDKALRLGRGLYSLEIEKLAAIPATFAEAAAVETTANMAVSNAVAVDQPAPLANSPLVKLAALLNESYVPAVVKGYVPFGNYKDIQKIIRSKRFYTIYTTGLSGNGKTMMFEQVCAKEGRELIRANITRETDEDDLIGGFRMVNGETVFQPGPVMIAMEKGAILLLDEVDLGSEKLMCLQPVLEGKPIFVKKIGKVIYPKPGFNVVATANTKGKGSDDGRFIGTNVQNEAFLERFAVWFEQEYPPAASEMKMLNNVLKEEGVEAKASKDYVERLVKWAAMSRKSYYDGALSEIISTRRLVMICRAFSIFEKEDKAVNLCLNRFDEETKTALMQVWEKLSTVAPEDDASFQAALDSLKDENATV